MQCRALSLQESTKNKMSLSHIPELTKFAMSDLSGQLGSHDRALQVFLFAATVFRLQGQSRLAIRGDVCLLSTRRSATGPHAASRWRWATTS